MGPKIRQQNSGLDLTIAILWEGPTRVTYFQRKKTIRTQDLAEISKIQDIAVSSVLGHFLEVPVYEAINSFRILFSLVSVVVCFVFPSWLRICLNSHTTSFNPIDLKSQLSVVVVLTLWGFDEFGSEASSQRPLLRTWSQSERLLGNGKTFSRQGSSERSLGHWGMYLNRRVGLSPFLSLFLFHRH